MLQNKRVKLVLKITVGLILFLWMSYSLYYQIRHQPDLRSTLIELQSNWNKTGIWYTLLVFSLMTVNWSMEAIKWKMLLRGTESIRFVRAFQSVLTGIAVSMITPNRIGEYIGRVLYLKNIHKLQGITVTIIGSFAQLLITGLLGLIGLLVYVWRITHPAWLNILLIASIILCAILFYTYFHLFKLIDWTRNISAFRKIHVYLKIIHRFDNKQLLRILFISLIRYLVYTLQFYLLLQLFLVRAPFWDLICTIWLIFWAMAIVPSIAIAEIGIRGETALFFLLPLSTNHLGIVSSTVLLWFVNLIIPALIGCLFVYRIRLYDDE